MNLLDVTHLQVEVAGRLVVDDLNLSLGAGERLAILGRNGAGKSTLLSALAGLRPYACGKIAFQGDCLDALPPRELALRRAWLGQTQTDPFGSTVLETAMTGRHPYLGRWAWESAHDLALTRSALAAVGLGDKEAQQIHTLSGGERQRLAIATLLAQAAPLYFLDEPLSHLDLNHQMAVLQLFSGAARDCQAGVVMVLHDPALAHRFCDRALLVYGDGRSMLGTVDEVLTSTTLSALYGYPIRQIEAAGQRCFIPE